MRCLAFLLALALPGAAALAQASACRIPAVIARPHLDGPTDEQPERVVPTTGYTLAVSWSPEYCHAKRGEARDAFQCGREAGARGARFGFTLHGLWPDGRGKDWPEYCRPAPLLPDAVIRANLCATPSPQLLQHEYAKHGTCTGLAPAEFFRTSSALYRTLSFPDMDALARRRALTAGQFADAFARATPGLRADMVRVNANRRGWLEEVWVCLGLDKRPRRCPADAGGADPNAALRIQRRDGGGEGGDVYPARRRGGGGAYPARDGGAAGEPPAR